MEDLLHIMRILRGEGGCPWDREQNHRSIRNNLIEETYEVVEAIDTDDRTLLREELGDVLLQVVFHSQMEDECNSFNFNDVCDGICKKLIHRHPHIFGNVIANSSEEVLKNWDIIKQKEKNQETTASTLEAVSRALPSLVRSCKV
ncbi:MAG: MazG family protein, partial [Angelakisella sp.]